jgi:anti-sigma factor (TIGR02949 family)
MSENCSEAIEQLYQYLDAELDELTASRVRVHLEDCSGCLDSFDFERRLKVVIRTHLEEEMPEPLVDKVKELIRVERQEQGTG